MGKFTPANMPYDVFTFARQPIFDASNEVWGFELLYRAAPEHEDAQMDDPELASMLISTCGFLQQACRSSSSQMVSINFTENLIKALAPQALPPKTTVVELAGPLSPEIQDSVRSLKKDGYLIAIDAYEGKSDNQLPDDLADIIKIDVLDRKYDEIRSILGKVGNSKAIKLAAKVDNHETHTMCKELGFELFQGYFYSMPHNIQGKRLPAFVSTKTELMRLLGKEDLDIDTLVETLKTDPSIGYRLLRYINSPFFGLSGNVDTIKRASDMLGLKLLSRWLQLVVMSDLSPKEKTVELYRKSLERAKYFETTFGKSNLGMTPESCFTFGLLSLLDALFDMPMEELLQQLPLGTSITDGYLNKSNILYKHLSVIKAIEQGDDYKMRILCKQNSIPYKHALKHYSEAIVWAAEAFSIVCTQ